MLIWPIDCNCYDINRENRLEKISFCFLKDFTEIDYKTVWLTETKFVFKNLQNEVCSFSDLINNDQFDTSIKRSSHTDLFWDIPARKLEYATRQRWKETFSNSHFHIHWLCKLTFTHRPSRSSIGVPVVSSPSITTI